MKRDFDLVVVGGAMAGAGVAALAAADSRTAGLRIALLEPKPVAAPVAGEPFDLRVSALSHASRQLLVKTGAWAAVEARGAAAYQRMVIWEERGDPAGRHLEAARCAVPSQSHALANTPASPAPGAGYGTSVP